MRKGIINMKSKLKIPTGVNKIINTVNIPGI